MSSQLLLRYAGMLLCAAGCVGAYWSLWRAPVITVALGQHRAWLDAELGFLRRPALGRAVVATQVALGPALALLSVAVKSWWPLASVPLVVLLPRAWLAQQRSLRIAILEEQLDPWLLALANALRGTPSLGDALASTAAVIPAPLREELEHVLQEWQLGVPLDQALNRAGARIGSRTLSAALLTLRVARTSGGSVSDCLENTAATLREMTRLDGIVRAKTAEGKAQALVISALPLPFFAVLHWLDPGFLAPLTVTLNGRALLALAATLWLTGIVLARRIVRLEL